jgi:hypothetical protein
MISYIALNTREFRVANCVRNEIDTDNVRPIGEQTALEQPAKESRTARDKVFRHRQSSFFTSREVCRLCAVPCHVSASVGAIGGTGLISFRSDGKARSIASRSPIGM